MTIPTVATWGTGLRTVRRNRARARPAGIRDRQSAPAAGVTPSLADIAAAAAGGVATYTSISFSVPADATRTLSPALTTAGRQLIRRGHAVSVFANIKLGGKQYSLLVTPRPRLRRERQ